MSKPNPRASAVSRSELPFPNATHHLPPRAAGAGAYMERTCRNHFWLGGELGQRRLKDMKVAIAGLGGMGSNIAEAMVRLGVGHLRVADPDTIDVSNINRQVIANRETVGKRKSDSSMEELRKIADDFELVVYGQGVTKENVDEFVEGCDAVIDEIDVYPMDRHMILHQSARKRGIPIYSAYVVGIGIHFYKFHGDEFTFEDFLNAPEEVWQKPSAEFILDRIGHPLPPYLGARGESAYLETIRAGKVPIFGPATLMGHSMVVSRAVLDFLKPKLGEEKYAETPTMPEFLVLDAASLELKKARVRGSKS